MLQFIFGPFFGSFSFLSLSLSEPYVVVLIDPHKSISSFCVLLLYVWEKNMYYVYVYIYIRKKEREDKEKHDDARHHFSFFWRRRGILPNGCGFASRDCIIFFVFVLGGIYYGKSTQNKRRKKKKGKTLGLQQQHMDRILLQPHFHPHYTAMYSYVIRKGSWDISRFAHIDTHTHIYMYGPIL